MASPAKASAFALEAGERPISIRRFAGHVALAGLINTTIAALLLFRLPASQEPSLHSLVIRAFIYVAGAVLAGMAGIRFYWNRVSTPFTTTPPLSFPRFAMVNAEAWVWVPAIVLLSRQDSPASSALSALGAALLASGIRHILPNTEPLRWQSPVPEFEDREMFSATLRTLPRESHGYIIALCLYATGYFLINHFFLNADAPLALAAFLFAWKLTLDPLPAPAGHQTKTRATIRLAAVATAAFLVTLFALLYGIDHRNRADAADFALTHGNGRGGDATKKGRRPVSAAISGNTGYESLILWPPPAKEQLVSPPPRQSELLAKGTKRPLVIRFDGPYWYYQSPNKRPGPAAHQAHATPLGVDIAANNFIPLVMEAHQNLGVEIPLARCSEIQVGVEDRNNDGASVTMAIFLSDSTAPGKPELYLGQQPIASTEPAQFTNKTAQLGENLQFTVPEHARIRRFDEITVMFLTDPGHARVGPKIAIEQFALLPR